MTFVSLSLYTSSDIYISVEQKAIDMQTKNKNNTEQVKLEEDGKIEIPIDFDDPKVAKELSKFLEENTPVLTFQSKTTSRSTGHN